MDRRAIALAGVLLAAALLGGLFGYHPGVEADEAPYSEGEPDSPYTAAMALEADGELLVAYDIRNDHADGEQLVTTRTENVTSTTYWHDNRSVVRSVSATEDRYRRQLRTADDERVVGRNDTSMTAVVADSDAGRPTDGPGLLLTTLRYPGYERTGTTTYEGREVTVYEARSGWYDVPSPGGAYSDVRVENADGVLYVAPATGQLYYTNVSYDAVGARTWGGYLLTKQLRGEQASVAVSIEYHPGETAVVRPDWAANASATGTDG